jgi:hypothetical protein
MAPDAEEMLGKDIDQMAAKRYPDQIMDPR